MTEAKEQKDRSVADVFLSIVGNVQEIVGSELRLAKAEIKEEVAKATATSKLLAAGAVTALFAVLFLLLAIASALTLLMPVWASALIVAALLAAGGGAMLKAGLTQFKHMHPGLDSTVKSIKENVQWAKQKTR